MTYKISEIDALVENMRYLLTQNNTQMKRVEIPAKLLLQAQELIKNRTGLTNITNKTLVIYALLNLFPTTYQDKLSLRLQDVHKQQKLSKLLISHKSPELKPNKQIELRLQQINDNQLKHDILLESLVNAVAWLIFDRNGMDKTSIAANSDEIYAKLRQDELKSIIDTLLRAGFNEDDRQKHVYYSYKLSKCF